MLIDSPPVFPTYSVLPSVLIAIWCGIWPTGMGLRNRCFFVSKISTRLYPELVM